MDSERGDFGFIQSLRQLLQKLKKEDAVGFWESYEKLCQEAVRSYYQFLDNLKRSTASRKESFCSSERQEKISVQDEILFTLFHLFVDLGRTSNNLVDSLANLQRRHMDAAGGEENKLLLQLTKAVHEYQNSAVRNLELERMQQLRSPILVLQDMDWRLDYKLRASAVGFVREPIYTLKMIFRQSQKSEHEPTFKEILMQCTLAQLQDLMTKLDDAKTSAEVALTQFN